VDGQRADVINNQEIIRLAHAYRIQYHLNDDTLREVQTYFKHQYVCVDPDSKSLKFSNHPVLHILNDYANFRIASAIALNRKDRLSTIELGATLKKVRVADHTCLLISDPREKSRYLASTSNATDVYRTDIFNFCRNGNASPIICVDGAQKCSFRADVLYSTNAIYDITFDDFGEIFARHDISHAYNWLYLPINLIDRELSVLARNYRIKFDDENGYVHFSPNDLSFTYSHKFDQWYKWYTHTRLRCPGFDIVLEIIESYGDFHLMRADRVSPSVSSMCLFRTFPISELAHDYCCVPNLSFLCRNLNYAKRKHLPNITVNRRAVELCLAYASRQVDGAYNFTAFSTVLSGQRHSIRIGKQIVQNAIDMRQDTFEDLAISLFIHGAIARYRRTKTISTAFNFIKKYGDDTFCDHLSLMFKGSIYAVKEKFLSCFQTNRKGSADDPTPIDPNARNMVNMPIRYFEDVEFSSSYHVKNVSAPGGTFSESRHAPRATTHITPSKPSFLADTVPKPKGPSSDKPPKKSAASTDISLNDFIAKENTAPHGGDVFAFDNGECPVTYSVNDTQCLFADGKVVCIERYRILKKRYRGTQFHCDLYKLLCRYEEDFKTYGSYAAGAKQNCQLDMKIVTRIVVDHIKSDANGADFNRIVELFASPLNFRCHDYCSKFREDRVFGAIGSFEEFLERTDSFYEGRIVYANPPFKSMHQYVPLFAKIKNPCILVAPIDEAKKFVNFNFLKRVPASSYIDGRSFIASTFGRCNLNTETHLLVNFPVTTKKVAFIATSSESESETPSFDSSITVDDTPIGSDATESESSSIISDRTPSSDESSSGTEFETEDEKIVPDFLLLRTILQKPKIRAGHCILTSVGAGLIKIGRITRLEQLITELVTDYIGGPELYDQYAVTAKMIYDYFVHGDFRNAYATMLVHNICRVYGVGIDVSGPQASSINPTAVERIAIQLKDEHFTYVGGFAKSNLSSIPEENENPEPIQDAPEREFQERSPESVSPAATYSKDPVLTQRASEKYDDILREFGVNVKSKIVDVSAAPGWIVRKLKERNFNVHVCVFEGEKALECLNDLKVDQYYDSFDHLMLPHRFEQVICDAACYFSEPIVEAFVFNVHRFVRLGGKVFIKHFNTQPKLEQSLRLKFKTVTNYRSPFTVSTSTEHYWMCNEYLGESMTFKVLQSDVDIFTKSCFTSTIPIVRNVGERAREFKACTIKCNYMFGIPGSNKSKIHAAELPNALFIVPTTKLKEQYASHNVKNVSTMHVALFDNTKYKDVVIDEAQTYPLGYFAVVRSQFPNANITLLGDADQINAINYEDDRAFRRLKDVGMTNNVFVTTRIPQDVVRAINVNYKRKYYSTSKVLKSVFIARDRPEKMPSFRFNKGNLPTIHEMIGSTVPRISFEIDDQAINAGLFDRPEHMTVALSRHLNQLIVYGNTDKLERFFKIGGTVIDTYSELNNVRLYDDQRIAPDHNELKLKAVLDPPNAEKIGANQSHIVDIFDRCLPKVNPNFANVSSYQNSNMPDIEQGTARVNLFTLQPKDDTVTGFKIPGFEEFAAARSQFSNSARVSAHTMFARSGRKTPKMSEKKSQKIAEHFFASTAKFIFRDDKYPVRKMKEYLRCKPGELEENLGEYIVKLQSKITGNTETDKVNLAELQREFDDVHQTVKFFSKKQVKFDPSVEFSSKAKAGQGVSAWTKSANLFFCSITRLLHKKIHELLKDKDATPIIIPTNEPDEQFSEQVAYLMNAVLNKKTNFKMCNNDFTEWDAHNLLALILLDCIYFEAMGISENIIGTYRIFRETWDLEYNYGDFAVKLYGELKQHSGQPNTLNGNTTGNIGATTSCLDFKDVQFAMFKGDDMVVCAKSMEFSDFGKKNLEELDFQLKLSQGDIGEFAGHILTPMGLFPDIFRRVAKFCTKLYTSEAIFEESKLSVAQDLSCIKNQLALEYGIQYLAKHYDYLGVTPDDIRVLHSFCDRVKEMKFGAMSKKVLQTEYYQL
jgi:hypothetical protein